MLIIGGKDLMVIKMGELTIFVSGHGDRQVWRLKGGGSINIPCSSHKVEDDVLRVLKPRVNNRGDDGTHRNDTMGGVIRVNAGP